MYVHNSQLELLALFGHLYCPQKMEETRIARFGVDDPLFLDLMESGFAPSLVRNDRAQEHMSVYEVITGSSSPTASAVLMARAI